MWGHLEKFIYLMKPEAITRIMVALLPDMMRAMPAGMVPIMKVARAIPGGLSLMGAMMPSMMPKLMPAMFAEVSRRVGPLPEDMEALMPDLLPQTMDALLPNMLPLIMDDFVPKMLCYIRHEFDRTLPEGFTSPCRGAVE